MGIAKPYSFTIGILLAVRVISYAQIAGTTTCTASLGAPILKETFGSGTGIGPPLAPGITNLQYENYQCVSDGEYTITNYTSGCFTGNWHATSDHTGDPDGYFMLINASYAPSDFYVQSVSNLCDGTTYLFSAWVMNMDVSVGTLPNITFTVEAANGTILGTYNTGNIPLANPAKWNQYGFYFTTPAGISTVVLRMRNNAPGGLGNDLALDDISFAPAGPTTTISITGSNSNPLSICSKSLNFLSVVENCYLSNGYQWQQSTDGGANWIDIPGANGATYTMPPQNPGTFMYRLEVAQAGDIASASCRVSSNALTIDVSGGNPATILKSESLCAGQSYTLPSGKIVTTSGVYNDTLYTEQGCDSVVYSVTLSATNVKTITSNVTICSGSQYILPWGETISSPGSYSDTLHSTGGCDSLITTVNISKLTQATATLNPTICSGGSYSLPSGKIVGAPGAYKDTLFSQLGCDSLIYSINLTAIAAKTVTLNANICRGGSYSLPCGVTISSPGTYSDTMHSSGGCDSLVTRVIVSQSVPVNTTTSAIFCKGSNYTLPWGTTAFDAGVFSDTIRSSGDCDSIITTVVLTMDDIPSGILPSEITKCTYSTVELSPGGSYAAYLWSNGSTSPDIEVTTGGLYWLQITDSNNCTLTDSTLVIDSSCNNNVYVPSAFTPNNDGRNDIFKPIIYGNPILYDFTVYNRSGQRLFHSSKVNEGWDGKWEGNVQPLGTYIWQLQVAFDSKSSQFKKGTVILVR